VSPTPNVLSNLSISSSFYSLSCQVDLWSFEHPYRGRYRAAIASEEDTRPNTTSMIKRLRIHHNHSVEASVKRAFPDSSCSAVNSGSQHLTVVKFLPGFSHCVGTDAPGVRTTINRSSPLLSPARVSTSDNGGNLSLWKPAGHTWKPFQESKDHFRNLTLEIEIEVYRWKAP
jgi:hypothetical protein